MNNNNSELDPKLVFNFVGYQFDLKEGRVRPTLAGLDNEDSSHTVWSCVPGPAVHVPHRSIHSNKKKKKQVHLGQLHTVALKEQLEGTRVTREGDPHTQIAPSSLKMVAGVKQCALRSTITPITTCSADLYRCIKRRVGHSLKQVHYKG